ncbi:hypothetical protein [Conexibacter sp. SYSU D00693]|uniref:hypothetical protein n=1 Tax=Conexibacter sp. SYSU D00693 TaxID=2812560 RepID=UPI00196B6F8F|nr:hypothetical protein [Conexibacter sp. SYSU D00693]
MPALRRTCRTITPVLAAACAIAAAGAVPSAARPAQEAESPPSIYQSKRLWATVNVCDTTAHPNAVGIRASMPGSGFASERMYVRFQVQYLSATDGAWHNIGSSGDSGWVKLGSARYRARQAGRTFTLKAPESGSAYRVRGAVTFEWRRGGDVVRRARKRTESGHAPTRGADPKRFSAASCVIA